MAHTSNVEWRKMLDNLRSAYQSLDPAEILVVELVANSLDAGATEISLTSTSRGDRTALLVGDNGRGMLSREEFERYHDLGSLSKQRGGTIGWAGIGAKLYLDRCEVVYTETRSANFSGASSWTFPDGAKAPTWEDVEGRGLVSSKTGTTVEVITWRGTDRLVFSRPQLEPLIRQNYNYALRPLGLAQITMEGGSVQPFNPRAAARVSEPISTKLRDGTRVTGEFFILSEPAQAGFELISIVVNGKIIGEQFDFRQLSRIKDLDRVSGYVRCDGLVGIVTTSKDSFNRKNPLWTDFNKRLGEAFARWLEANGQLLKVERDADFEALAAEVGRDLNKLFTLPEIRSLGLDLFQLFGSRRTAIETPGGDQSGSVIEGSQPTTGTLGGDGSGAGVITEGDDPGKGIRTDPLGNQRVTERPRQTRGGIRIAYGNQPDRLERAWVDPGLRAILINQAHPAFSCADGLESLAFYTAECCFAVVTEHLDDVEARETVTRKLFEAFVKIAG